MTGGRRGWPFWLPLTDLASVGYVAEEFFLDGTASAYEAELDTELAMNGKWRVRHSRNAPFLAVGGGCQEGGQLVVAVE